MPACARSRTPAAVLAATLLGGCGTIGNLFTHPEVYGGVRDDLKSHGIEAAAFTVLDLPISFAADTALLPVTGLCGLVRWLNGGYEPGADLGEDLRGKPALGMGRSERLGFDGSYMGREPGIQVERVDPNGPAAAAGVRPGDAILEADGKPIRDLHDLRAILEAKPGGEGVSVKIKRGSAILETRLQPRGAE